MQHAHRVLFRYVFYLNVLVWTGAIANPSPLISQLIQSTARITHNVEDVAQDLGYRSMRGTRISDEWAEAEKQGWLVDHAYLTLFGPDSDNSHLGINGRVEVTILAFKDEEISKRELAKIEAAHAGNIGFKVIREGRDGYLIEEGNGLYAAVIDGADLLLLEDRSRLQRRTIAAIADAVAKKTR